MELATYSTVLILGAGVLGVGLFNFAWAFAAWCAIYPSVAMFTSLPGLAFLPAGRAVTSLLALEAAVLCLRDGTFPKLRSLWLWYAAFLGALIASSVLSIEKGPSLARSLTYVEPLMWVFLAATAVRRSRWAPRLVLGGLVLGMVPVAGYGLLELALQRNILADNGLIFSDFAYIDELRFGGMGRVSSTFGQPVYAALYFLMAVAILLFFCRRSRSIAFVISGLALALLSLVCLIFTGARTGLLGLAILPIGNMFIEGRGWRSIGQILAVYVLVALLVFAILPSEYQQFIVLSFDPTSSQSANLIGRLYVTEQLWLRTQGHMLFGLGPGLVPRMALAHAEGFQGLGGVENQYLGTLADAGIIGLTTLAAFFVSVFRFLRRSVRSEDAHERGWATITGIVLFTILLLAVSVSILNNPIMCVPLTGLGVVIGLRDRSEETLRVPVRPALRAVDAGSELLVPRA